MSHGVNPESFAYAQGGRNLLTCYGEAAQWEHEAIRGSDPDPDREVQAQMQALRQLQNERYDRSWQSATPLGGQRIYTSPMSGQFPLVNTFALGMGTIAQNPAPKLRRDYFRC